MKKTIILLALTITTSIAALAQTFPYGINYQAVARDANGNAQVNTSVPLRFTIKKTSASGINVWQETQTQNTNSMGQFNAVIGTGVAVNPFITTNFSQINWSNDNYFLMVEIQTGISTFAQIGATTQFQSVPYALAAPDPTPAGAIIAFGGINAPAGYLLCRGQVVSRAGAYARLFAAIGTAYGNGDGSTTFNVPDFRGMFLRGMDSTAINDPNAATRTAVNGGNSGAKVGSVETDALQGHLHGWRGFQGISLSGGGGSWVPRAGSTVTNTAYPGDDGDIILNPTGDGVNGTVRTSSETRPKNISVNYIIKY